ncbi:MAG: DUF5615 family PIN-like protein [Planctomycetota bacterium]
MRIKIDENLPATLVDRLNALGHDADSVPGEGLAGVGDSDVWRRACTSGRFLITQDLDFSDQRAFTPGTHPGILLLRLRNPPRRLLIARVDALFASEDVEQWVGCIVVATEHKIRVRRPN